MTLETPFRSRAPARLEALLWSAIFLLFPATAIFSEVWWAWLLAIPCFFMAGVLCLSVVSPAWFLDGMRRFPGGFEVRRPLRRAVFVEIKSIRRIEAVIRRDGEMGFSFFDFMVRTRHGSVRLPEGELHETGLIAELQALPNFDAEAYAQALQYEPSGVTKLVAKRFLLLDVA